jgi:type IV pilus assembly protein PilO
MKFIDELQAFSQDPADIGRRSVLFRLVLVGLLFLLIAIGLSIYEYKNKTPILETAQAKQAQLLETLKFKHKKAVNLEAYKKQLADMETTFEGMLNQLPGKTELDNLLIDISNAGLGAGLDQKQFQKNAERKQDFYAELPISITLQGDYHQMGDFVSRVAALPRIVTLHDFKIKHAGSTSRSNQPTTSGDDLVMQITAKTYRYLEDDEVTE